MSEDPMKTDQDSDIDHDEVLSQAEALKLIDRTWEPMVESETHLVVRRFVYGKPKSEHDADAIVIVARGRAAQLLSDFTPTIPSFNADADEEDGIELERQS